MKLVLSRSSSFGDGFYLFYVQQTPLNTAFLGLVKSGSNNRLALLAKVIYIVLHIQTTKGCSIKRRELLTVVYCISVCLKRLI